MTIFFFSGSFARWGLFSGLLKLPLRLNFRLISTSVLSNRETPESYRKRSEIWIAMWVNNTIHQIVYHSMGNGMFSVLFLFVATSPLYLFRSIVIVDNAFAKSTCIKTSENVSQDDSNRLFVTQQRFVKSLCRVPQLPRRYLAQFLPFKFLNDHWIEKACNATHKLRAIFFVQHTCLNFPSNASLEPFFFCPFMFELKNVSCYTSIVVDGFPLRITQENRSV